MIDYSKCKSLVLALSSTSYSQCCWAINQLLIHTSDQSHKFKFKYVPRLLSTITWKLSLFARSLSKYGAFDFSNFSFESEGAISSQKRYKRSYYGTSEAEENESVSSSKDGENQIDYESDTKREEQSNANADTNENENRNGDDNQEVESEEEKTNNYEDAFDIELDPEWSNDLDETTRSPTIQEQFSCCRSLLAVVRNFVADIENCRLMVSEQYIIRVCIKLAALHDAEVSFLVFVFFNR